MPDTPVIWASPVDVALFLGIPTAEAGDDDWLIQAPDAANAVAWRRRLASGYVADDPTTAPDEAVKTGTTMYAAALYRERGAADGFASFVELGAVVATGGSWAQIQTDRSKELIGQGADAVFVTFGSADTARQASNNVRIGGRIVYFGTFPEGVSFHLDARRLGHGNHLQRRERAGAIRPQRQHGSPVGRQWNHHIAVGCHRRQPHQHRRRPRGRCRNLRNRRLVRADRQQY